MQLPGEASPGELLQMPSGVHFSFLGSFMLGTPGFPLSEVPLQMIVDRVAAGTYRAKPARRFGFDEIGEAHRVMESSAADGKLVVRRLSKLLIFMALQTGLKPV